MRTGVAFLTYMMSGYPAGSNAEKCEGKLLTLGRLVAIECREEGDDDSYMQRLASVTSFRKTAKREREFVCV